MLINTVMMEWNQSPLVFSHYARVSFAKRLFFLLRFILYSVCLKKDSYMENKSLCVVELMILTPEFS